MAAFFSLGVAFTLRLVRGDDTTATWAALGVSIGLAALAKGLVPLVLAAPLLWFLKERWRRWWIALLSLFAAAGPWYGMVIHANGAAFVKVFFWQQQFSRIYSDALQHVRPWYFYLPVTLGLLFPWTPLLLTFRPSILKYDRRLGCLAAVFAFGFVFFSLSLNKLPGYVLPLLPSLLAIIGVGVTKGELYLRRPLLLACAALIAITPLVGRLAPRLLTSRFSSPAAFAAELLPITFGVLVLVVTPLVVSLYAARALAAPMLFLCLTVAAIEVKSSVYPILDQQASPREFWREIAPVSDRVCDAGLHRAWEYGLEYYRGAAIPFCDQSPKPIHLIQHGEHRAERSVNGRINP
jgi:4-amino-4-deoxy-L-arabinose transferase